jgi:hypothetical protein
LALDVETAFLHKILKEEIYMMMLEGYDPVKKRRRIIEHSIAKFGIFCQEVLLSHPR